MKVIAVQRIQHPAKPLRTYLRVRCCRLPTPCPVSTRRVAEIRYASRHPRDTRDLRLQATLSRGDLRAAPSRVLFCSKELVTNARDSYAPGARSALSLNGRVLGCVRPMRTSGDPYIHTVMARPAQLRDIGTRRGRVFTPCRINDTAGPALASQPSLRRFDQCPSSSAQAPASPSTLPLHAGMSRTPARSVPAAHGPLPADCAGGCRGQPRYSDP